MMTDFPAGTYQCPKCSNEIQVFVPLKEEPLHRCSGSGTPNIMVYKGKTNSRRTSASRDSVG